MNKRLLLWLMIIIGALIVFMLLTRNKIEEKPISGEPEMPKIVILDENTKSDIELPQNIILDDQQAYQDFLVKYQLNIQEPIDLRERTVIAVFMGMRPTGGYSIQVTDYEEIDDQIHVYVTMKIPGEKCFNIQAFTYPYQIVSIKKTNRPIEIFTQTEVYDCP